MERGVVVRYDADRGFGFVRSRAFGADDVFVHASSVVGGGALRPGQRVRFSAEPSAKGPRATRVEPGRPGLAPAMAAGLAAAVALAAATFGLGYYRHWSPIWAWLAAINPATFLAYALDKSRASGRGRRIPERVLLGLALIGGTPGAAIAMFVLRHKTRKLSFLVPFALIVALQAAGLAWWVWPRGRG